MNFNEIKDEKILKIVEGIIENNELSIEQIRDIGAIIMGYALYIKLCDVIKDYDLNELGVVK